MAPTNEEKVSGNYIPDDDVFIILSKLPVKSIKRFSCACKSWSLLFETPNFINMFRDNLASKSHPIYNNSCLILNQIVSSDYHSNLYLLSGDNYENKVKLDLPPPFDIQQNDITLIRILDSAINGILCIYNCDNHTEAILWNLTTKEIKVIPPSRGEFLSEFMSEFSLHGFGYDHVRDDYKVIQHVSYTSFDDCLSGDLTPKPFFEIYNLQSNSWKKLDFDMPTCYLNTNSDVYFNGVCHWVGKAIGVTYVVSFDLSDEVFFSTPLPLEDVHRDFYVNLAVLNDSIAIISNYKEIMSFQILILGEFGVKESWIRLYDIEPFYCIGHPIGTGKKGNIFFRKEDDELACFDLTTAMIEDIGLKGEKFRCQMVIYNENHHPIGRINN